MRPVERYEMPTVYHPAEDSQLLATSVLDRIDPHERVLEVGSGSGYVAAHVREKTGAYVVGSDVNPDACAATRERGIEAVRADLTHSFAAGSFDVVLFNPPYLPTPPEHEWDDPLEYALSGGEDGRRVIRPFLEDVGRVLTESGRVYLLVSSLTDIEAVTDLAAGVGLETQEIADDSYPFERLVLLELLPGMID